MSEFRVSGDMFGRYVTIPTGFDKQQHVYKVVGMIESNGYCDVPITGWTEKIHHDEIVPVLLVIHCGICEEKVIRGGAERLHTSGGPRNAEVSMLSV